MNRVVSLVPPGQYFIDSPKHPGNGMHVKLGISISFRDSRGKFWRRDATGTLEEIVQHPFVANEIEQPIDSWSELTPLQDIKKTVGQSLQVLVIPGKVLDYCYSLEYAAIYRFLHRYGSNAILTGSPYNINLHLSSTSY